MHGALDRLLGTWLGAAADSLARSEPGVLAGLLNGEVTATPLAEMVATPQQLDLGLLTLARILAT